MFWSFIPFAAWLTYELFYRQPKKQKEAFNRGCEDEWRSVVRVLRSAHEHHGSKGEYTEAWRWTIDVLQPVGIPLPEPTVSITIKDKEIE